jgi:hypothetical protein
MDPCALELIEGDDVRLGKVFSEEVMEFIEFNYSNGLALNPAASLVGDPSGGDNDRRGRGAGNHGAEEIT